MKKSYFAGLVAMAIIALGIIAVPKTMAAKLIKEDRSITIDGATPDHPVVSLGKGFDKKSGKGVEGYAIVHYAKGLGNPAKSTPTPVCYGYLAPGAKWKGTPEPWTIDNVNTGGIDKVAEFNILDKSIVKWEVAAGTTEGILVDILGLGDSGSVAGTKVLGKTLDGKNQVTFAPIKSRGAIAVTYIWGNFGDPIIANRQLMEWDQIYNTAYAWSTSVSGIAGKMDFENIATHELGHSVGMNDLYSSRCSIQTMYGYANYGQIDKRDLESGDITGINALYY